MSLNTESLNAQIKPFLEPVAQSAAPLFQESFLLHEPEAELVALRDLLSADGHVLVLALLNISGDYEGEAGLVLHAHNALLLSGKLDNLDPQAIQEKMDRQTLSQRDVENVKAWLNTMAKAFVESLTSQGNLNLSLYLEDPVMVYSHQSLPLPEEELLRVVCPMSLGQEQLDPLIVAIPSELYSTLPQGEQSEAGSGENEDAPEADASLTPEELRDILGDEETDTEQPEEREEPAEAETAAQASEEKETEEEQEVQEEEEEEPEGVDPQILHQTLSRSLQNGEEELGDLLGKGLELREEAFTVKGKSEIFSEHTEKLVMTKLLVSGEIHGEIYTLLSVPDAVYLGGTLLMLPEEEVKKKVKTNNFGEDEADAYGEIVNILSGNLSKTFAEYYPRKLHIKKDRMETLVPTKLEASSPEPFPDGEYFYASYRIQMGSNSLGSLELVFPLHVLDLSRKQKEQLLRESKGASQTEPPAVAILSENPEENKNFTPVLASLGFEICFFTFRDNIKEKLRPYNVQTVLVILSEVNEKSLAKLIKIQSLFRDKYPAIVAAPNWTRTQVLQAVQYGAHDILKSPPDPEAIQLKFEPYAPALAEAAQ